MGLINAIVITISALAVGLAIAMGLVFFGGLPVITAAISAFLIIVALFQINFVLSRGQQKLKRRREISGLLKATANLSAELDKLRCEFLDFRESPAAQTQGEWEQLQEQLLDLQQDQTRLSADMAMTETLVKQLMEELANSAPPQAPARDRGNDVMTGQGNSPAAPREVAPAETATTPPPERLEEIRRSLEQNKIDLYLQPVVSLPQRKVRFYEALTRLRDRDGAVILPAEYIPLAEPAGIMPVIDNLLLFRAVQLVRRFDERGSKAGVFCNISPHSLLDSEFFPQFIEFLEQNRDLSEALIFEFSQSVFDAFGPLEEESLRALASLGFRFSLDHVTRLDVDFQSLAASGVQFLKVDADILMHRMEESGARIHVADLSSLLERYNIRLIAEKIENERSVVNVLDFDVALGQGYLFGKPRLVRGDVRSGADAFPLKMAS